ncbi:MAG TPA: MarR family transcriptional regulator [Leifsonia sp.]|jgi:DNA-binding MarR family transcriptional regulator|nr:MarR family transcriptional regulator [Leifsonia sp.]
MPSHDTPHDPWTEFVSSVFTVNGLIIRAGEAIVGPLGESSARWQVLGRAFGGMTVADMAKEIGHARQSTQRVANDLVADGLAEYRPHPTDRRTQIVHLTDRGRNLLEQIYERQLQWSQGVFENLPSTELVDATEALRSVAAQLEMLISQSNER